MKIPASVRSLFEELTPRYNALKESVDKLVSSKKERRWHYESRIKTEQSFALKLETGRERNPAQPEDFFACTIVVENQTRVGEAEALVCGHFDLVNRKPERVDFAPLAPYNLDFDDLRLYVKWRDDAAQKPTGLNGLLFEFQIKTFLQHAWSVATHDLVYKTDDVNWGTSRIAYLVKATLENAELSIAEARQLKSAAMLSKSDRSSNELLAAITEIRKRWDAALLPKDLRRLALNILDNARILRIDIAELWQCVDSATASGSGTKTLNLSPHGAVISSLLKERGPAIFSRLASPKGGCIFVPNEIELPKLSAEIMSRIVRA